MSGTFEFLALHRDTDPPCMSFDQVYEIIAQLYNAGYFLVEGYAWPFTNPQNALRDLAAVKDRLAKKYSEQPSLLSEVFWRHPFEFTFSWTPGGQFWVLGIQQDTLTGQHRNLGEQNAQELVEVLRTFLQGLKPYFGCGAPTLPTLPFTEPSKEFIMTEACPINFYSLAYIHQRLNQNQLLSAPAWRVETIADGVLVIPSLKAIYADDPESLAALAAHLGWRT